MSRIYRIFLFTLLLTVLIPKDVFVDITQNLAELRSSVMLDYMFMFAQDAEVSTLALAYRYAFSRGAVLKAGMRYSF